MEIEPLTDAEFTAALDRLVAIGHFERTGSTYQLTPQKEPAMEFDDRLVRAYAGLQSAHNKFVAAFWVNEPYRKKFLVENGIAELREAVADLGFELVAKQPAKEAAE